MPCRLNLSYPAGRELLPDDLPVLIDRSDIQETSRLVFRVNADGDFAMRHPFGCEAPIDGTQE